MKKHCTLLYRVRIYDTKRSRFELPSPSSLFVATPLFRDNEDDFFTQTNFLFPSLKFSQG